MPFTFKSQACADLLMLEKPAKELLAIIGKTPSPTGIIEIQDIPAAITALQQAINEEKNRSRQNSNTPENTTEDETSELDTPVSLHQRAWPLIEMLSTSYQAKEPVVWGI